MRIVEVLTEPTYSTHQKQYFLVIVEAEMGELIAYFESEDQAWEIYEKVCSSVYEDGVRIEEGK